VQLFVVPWTPGPLLPVETSPPKERYERSLGLDGLLVALGFFWIVHCIMAMAHGRRLPVWLSCFGVPGVPHLLVTPVLKARHDRRLRLESRRRDRLLRDALLLDPSDPHVRALIVAYRNVLTASRLPELTAMGDGPASAAHAALVECAVLLAGAPASVSAERSFVQARVAALGGLASALNRRHRGAVAEVARAAQATEDEQRRTRLEAVTDVYHDDQGGSLAQLVTLQKKLGEPERHEQDR